jgi:APA family basic amino acid/polyamine antiporter
MSRHLQLPQAFQTVHPRRRTPWVALAFFTLAAIGVLCATQNMDRLAQLYNFGSMLAFSLAHLSLLGLRVKEPNLERPYKAPLNVRIAGREVPLTAVVGLLATFGAWVAVVVLHPAGRNLGLAWVAFGLILYWGVRRRQEIPLVESVRIERVAVPEYKAWQLKHVLVATLGGRDTETVQIAARTAKEHGAELTALYVIEIPEALPLETFLVDQLQRADEALARAEAIARESGVAARPKVLQAREAGATICEVAREEGCDLIILGAARRAPSLGRTVESVLRSAPCRVWVCTPGA